MKALLLCAGLGTRLRPLTDDRPKALVEINGKSLLERNCRRLGAFGIMDIVVNIHYFASQIILHLKKESNFGLNIQCSDEQEALLDTGGALLKAKDLLLEMGNANEPILICNVDVLTDLNLNAMLRYHQSNRAMVTMAVRKRKTSRYLRFDEGKQLCGWRNVKSGAIKESRKSDSDLIDYGFSGIHIVSPKVFALMMAKNYRGKFSIIDFYLDIAQDQKVLAYDHTPTHWLDVGKLPAIPKAEQLVHCIR